MTSFKVGPKISAFFLMGLRNTTDYLNQLIWFPAEIQEVYFGKGIDIRVY
jgi:hypothetical protein